LLTSHSRRNEAEDPRRVQARRYLTPPPPPLLRNTIMALKSILESLDGLPEDIKKEYTEKDGKFYLDLEGLDDHPAVGALKRAKDHEKTLRQTAEGKLREAEDKSTQLEGTIEELRTGAIPKDDVTALKN